jgi:uncharacterized membrane protein
MLPDPLHPAVVHLPVALAVLMPLAALAAFVAIARGWMPARTWVAVVALQALLVGATWLAVETGEEQEERVERVVAERHIETHEEGAERFLGLALAALVVTGVGLLGGRAGQVGRAASVVAAAGLLVAAAAVGHSGGELVYRHGAAQVYVDAARAGTDVAAAGAPDRRPHARDEEDTDHD